MGFLIKDGKSSYEICYAPEGQNIHKFAAEELQSFLLQSTGVELPITQTLTDEKPQIRIGFIPENASNAGINDSGFYIKTVGENVHIYGASASGTMYGVYELLHRLIGFEAYAYDEVYFEKKAEIELPNFDVVDSADIEYRIVDLYNIEKRGIAPARRMRVMWFKEENQTDAVVEDEWYRGFFGEMFAHTCFQLVPKEKDEKGNLLHPEWYSREGNQLCWTNEEVSDKLIENLKEHIRTHENTKMFQIGIEDNQDFCDCETCKASHEKYGLSGTHVRFINRIANAIEAWRKEEIPNRRVELAAFAYLKTKEAPVIKDETTGEWKPIDESVRLAPNVSIFNAPIDRCGFHSIDAPCNKKIKERLDKWAAVAKRQLIWDYHAYFDNVNYSLHNYPNYKDDVQHYVKYNALLAFFEGTGYSPTTGWHDLRAYLLSKLSWDCTLDQDKLTDDFFHHYYKQTAPLMKKYFEMEAKHYRWLVKDYNRRGKRGYHTGTDLYYAQPEINTVEHWPKKAVLKWKKVLEQALEIAKAEPNPEIREKLERRVCFELATPTYILANLYTYYSSLEEFNAAVDEFKAVVNKAGLFRWSGFSTGPTLEYMFKVWHERYPARADRK